MDKKKLIFFRGLKTKGFSDKFYYNAKIENNVSDTQLYMQAGNSVTVMCSRSYA